MHQPSRDPAWNASQASWNATHDAGSASQVGWSCACMPLFRSCMCVVVMWLMKHLHFALRQVLNLLTVVALHCCVCLLWWRLISIGRTGVHPSIWHCFLAMCQSISEMMFLFQLQFIKKQAAHFSHHVKVIMGFLGLQFLGWLVWLERLAGAIPAIKLDMVSTLVPNWVINVMNSWQ